MSDLSVFFLSPVLLCSPSFVSLPKKRPLIKTHKLSPKERLSKPLRFFPPREGARGGAGALVEDIEWRLFLGRRIRWQPVRRSSNVGTTRRDDKIGRAS